MIASISLNSVTPIQPGSTVNEGESNQAITTTTDENSNSTTVKSDPTSQSNQNSSQNHDQKKKLEEIVKGLNDFLKPTHTSLKFKLYEKLNQYYCQVINDDTKEVIREIPPKKLLDAYAIMAEQLGFIIDKKI